MAKIQIYARLRPTQNPYEGLQTSCSKDCDDTVTINTESTNDQLNSMYSKSPGSKLNFRFNRVFGMRSTQDEIFDTVAKEMIDTFLDGYNGTVFAYGQTSSGKTYTIEGSGRKFVDRGLIPRTLSYIYKEIEKRSVERDVEMSVHISYMEIYQDTGYDLLNPGMRPGALMVEVPKVQVAEGPGGEIRVRDLSLHLAATEEVAQSLLFQGSTCRKVAETSMNQCSSRSHTIFSIVLTAKTGNSEVITRSKLNLVDLAGSERVAKTGADGRVLREAKHINLSLHHLEHVIVTLQQYSRQARAQGLSTPPTTTRLGTGISEKTSQDTVSSGSSARYNTSRGSLNSSRAGLSSRHSSSPDNRTIRSVSRPWTRRGHVPYRNCMLTMVLKDSLGGNCLTAMIATISADESNIHETIATCRFSQRVACISNRARRNEELDDKVVIRKLRQRVAELEAEIQSLKDHTYLSPTLHPPSPTTGWSSTFDRPLSDNDRQRCHQILYGFFHGKIENPVGAGIDSAAMFQESLLVLRTIVLQSLGINKDTANQSDESSSHTVEQIRHAAYSESPSAQSTSPPVDKETQSATGEPRLINVAPRNKKSKTFATPSPHSRLSSGFGSLHDEDGSVNYEVSSYQVGQGNQVGHGSGVVELRDSHSQSFENGLREHGHKRHHRRHKRHRHTISGEAPLADVGVKNHTHTNRERRAKHTHEETELNSSIIPPPPIGAWTSPNTSASNRKSGEREPSIQSVGHSNDWSLQCTPPAHIATADDSSGSMLGTEQTVVSPQEMKVLSPRAERKRKKLQSKQVELMRSREEKKRLASEVNLLNLKVEEEGTKDELSHIGELLATQHVQYTQLNKGGASPEQLCAEKIAEQQLRIKQAKLHQRLLDVQYQLRMSGDGIMDSTSSAGTGRDTHPTSPKYSSPAPVTSYAEPTTSPPPGNAPHVVRKMPTPQIENEILKHDLRQSKVQQQIEKLRISQMEKQLELKEASTRRKILALKQQLQGGSKPPSTAPAKPSTHTAALPSKGSIPSSKSDQLLATIQPQLGTYREKPSHWSESSSVQTNIVHSTMMPTHRPSHDTSDVPSNKLTQKVTSRIRSDITKRHTPSQLEISSDSVTIQSTPNDRSDPATASNKKSQASGSTNGNPPTPQSRTLRQKLTLPEEIKETEYMSAVQRQKARVCRIRRCIVAATVIQRAWRDYKIVQK